MIKESFTAFSFQTRMLHNSETKVFYSETSQAFFLVFLTKNHLFGPMQVHVIVLSTVSSSTGKGLQKTLSMSCLCFFISLGDDLGLQDHFFSFFSLQMNSFCVTQKPWDFRFASFKFRRTSWEFWCFWSSFEASMKEVRAVRGPKQLEGNFHRVLER